MLFTAGATLAFVASAFAQSSPGVIATGTMGVTNPPAPTTGTAVNQTSDARLLSLNSIDDFCIFAPPEPNTEIGVSEAYEVAWCTKARNNARVIPDGVITGLRYIETDFYVQIMGYGDFTKLNIPFGDYGGELDPHGATGEGNPVGGNVTNNRSGSDVSYEEWMMFISYQQFCIRVCTASNDTYSAALMCEHKLDEMGCEYVMPGDYNFNGTFETCDAEVAYPPGVYPIADAATTTYSTFAQYYTGVYTDDSGAAVPYTVGDLVTPSSAAFTPSSSNCQSTSTVTNGIDVSGASPSGSSGGSSGGASGTKSGGSASPSSSSGSSSGGSDGSDAAYSVNSNNNFITLFALVSGVAAIALFH